MTQPSTPDLLLDASGVAKRYGAVAALRDASIQVRRGEVHALLGANGAGKSTFVKILTGAVRPDAGTVLIDGEARDIHSPAIARRSGLISVYQEPALIPDLDIERNLHLTDTPVEPFRHWLAELGIPKLDLGEMARDLPLAVLRVIDLARALALDPEVLLLDEMTAALPADLTEKVIEVVGRRRETGNSVIFISHRLIEIAALCDRATVLRDGETVGRGGRHDGRRGAHRPADARTHRDGARPGDRPQRQPGSGSAWCRRMAARRAWPSAACEPAPASTTSRSSCGSARSSGSSRSTDRARTSCSACSPARAGRTGAAPRRWPPGPLRAPADAIREGIVYVPANRVEALLMQRSVRENIALPFSARVRDWGAIRVRQERVKVEEPSSGSRSTPGHSRRSGACPAATSRR